MNCGVEKNKEQWKHIWHWICMKKNRILSEFSVLILLYHYKSRDSQGVIYRVSEQRPTGETDCLGDRQDTQERSETIRHADSKVHILSCWVTHPTRYSLLHTTNKTDQSLWVCVCLRGLCNLLSKQKKSCMFLFSPRDYSREWDSYPFLTHTLLQYAPNNIWKNKTLAAVMMREGVVFKGRGLVNICPFTDFLHMSGEFSSLFGVFVLIIAFLCVCVLPCVLYLYSKYSTHSNNAEDVEDSWAHDGANPDVTFSDEHSCTAGTQ